MSLQLNAEEMWLQGDRADAVEVWRELATSGDPRSCFNLAILLEANQWPGPDLAQAAALYRRAHRAGFSPAAQNLALLLESLPEKSADDISEIVSLYAKLAAEGLADAQFRVGLMLDTGEWLDKDAGQAARWYFQAAEQGHPKAAVNLARCFAMGEGLEQNNQMAYKWYSIAAELGNVNAARYRERVAQELTPEQRVSATGFASHWLANFKTNL